MWVILPVAQSSKVMKQYAERVDYITQLATAC